MKSTIEEGVAAMYPTMNPFYAARIERAATTVPGQVRNESTPNQSPNKRVYARLPQAPVTASPVPHLTSLYHRNARGPWGDSRYPGNCSGYLIRDLLLFFQPQNVFDPMTGSGTCSDVCRDLGITCISTDIRDKQDACDEAGFQHDESFDFVWAHPPYWRQKLYTADSRDLSRQPTLAGFRKRYSQFITNCAVALAPGGKLAILMGDYTDFEAGFVPLVYWTKHFAFKAGLRQCCTDIIRFSHGASSAKKVYRSSFIPGLHDVCMVFEKADSITVSRQAVYPTTGNSLSEGDIV